MAATMASKAALEPFKVGMKEVYLYVQIPNKPQSKPKPPV